MEKDFHKKVECCPYCGSKDRFFEQLAQELKDRGLARTEWNMYHNYNQGVVLDSSRQLLIPVGVTLPGFIVATDICMNCLGIYAVELQRLEARTELRDVRNQLQQPKN